MAVSLQVKDRLPDAVKQREGLRKHYITILYKFFETWQLVVGSNWVESQNFLSRMWLLLAWECTTVVLEEKLMATINVPRPENLLR